MKTEVAQLLVFKQVTLIDTMDGQVQPNMTVMIRGNHITEMGKAGEVNSPKGAQVVEIDATGKFLIPGLWDMHVHTSTQADCTQEADGTLLVTLICEGVTGVRDMGGSVERIMAWRNDIAVDRRIGPRIIAAGPFLDGPRQFTQFRHIVTDPSEAYAAVAYVKKCGGDFVKVHDWLSAESYFAIIEAAKQQGLSIAGHVPVAVRVAEASNAGQKSIEHLGSIVGGILLSCSSREEELRNEYLQERQEKGDFAAFLHAFKAETIAKMLDSYDHAKATALISLLAKNGTWQVPTLVVERGNQQGDPMGEVLLQKQLELVGTMYRAGVPLMAGTDSIPDVTIHDELALLVQAGLTPAQALQTATYAPAKFLGKLNTLGSIEQGKLADLVLLAANPLEEITNTRQISAVVVNGRLLDRETLDKMARCPESILKKW